MLTIPAPVHATSHIQGEVSLDPQAVVAPGVCLIANPGSRIQVGAGVCLGMGTILHAHGDGIVLETGVIVGAGVLLIGAVRVGAQTCIGSASTVYNAIIAAGQVVTPGSLLGETGRMTSEVVSEVAPESILEPPVPSATEETIVVETTQAAQTQPSVVGLQYFNQLRVTLRTRGGLG